MSRFIFPACQDPCQARKNSYLTFLSNTVPTNEIWKQVARLEITAVPLFSIMCCSFYLSTLCMLAVNVNAVTQNYFIL